jgi:hypothetical protein
MKKGYFILLATLSIACIGTGCINNTETNAEPNDNESAEGEIKVEPTDEDLLAFLFTYQEATKILSTEYESFLNDSIDPKLQAAYATNNSDIPLMRFLGKKGLNDIESSSIKERIDALKNSIVYSDFYGSVEKLENGINFLEEFYGNIETLNTFDEFKLYTADLMSSKEEMEKISSTFQFEYEYFQNSYEGIDYKLTDSLAWLIGEQNEIKSISLNEMDATYSETPIKFIGKTSANTQKIVVTAQYGGKTDIYTLENFNPGDTTFQYQAAEKWDNLAEGSNSYDFVAYFKDGTTRHTTQTISYYSSSSTTSTSTNTINTSPTYYYSPVETSNDNYGSCCKICTTGKACGDSCISKSYTCHKPSGCACDG